MNSNDFVSVNHILAEVTATLNDKDFRSGFASGWYVSRIQDALQELAFDTFYGEITLDFDVPKDTLAMELPQNVFNIREIHLYDGDCCSPNASQVVHYKRQFNNKGKGDGYTARIKDMGEKSQADPFLPDHYNYNSSYAYLGTKYYANVQNGMLMLSTDCREFTKIRLVVNTMGVAIGDEPIIPRFFERAINDYVEERFYNAMKSRDIRKYRPLWNDAYARLTDPRDGSWKKARMRVSQMDTWEKESYEEYISSMYHK
jgi:hypothetical protein